MKKHILAEMNLKTTEELIDIWRRNNRAEWTDEAFEVIKEIIMERSGELPSQNKPSYQLTREPSQPLFGDLFRIPNRKNSKSRYETLKQWILSFYMGGMFLFIIIMALYEWMSGHKPEPGFAVWLMLVTSGGMFIWLGADLTLKTWFAPNEFIDHLAKNVIPNQKKWTLPFLRWMVPNNTKYLLWNYRLMVPVVVLMGFFFFIMAYSFWFQLHP